MDEMMGAPTPKAALDTLRDRIAEGIAGNVKAYNVPAVCVRVGIQDGVEPGDADEAFRSRRVYVKNRLVQLDRGALLTIAAALLKEFDIPNLAEIVSELTVHATHRITEITRRDALKVLSCLDTLFNDVDLFDGLNIVSSEHLSHDGIDNNLNFLPSLVRDIVQHYVRNSDYSTEELLIRCGAVTCSQTKFFALLEKWLHPVVRRGDEQVELATHLNAVLRPDGFQVAVVGEQSTHPIPSGRQACRSYEVGTAGENSRNPLAGAARKLSLGVRNQGRNRVDAGLGSHCAPVAIGP